MSHHKRVCFQLRVKKDRIDEYKTRHREVWPEMIEALRQTGWKNYSLFLQEDGLLIGYLETADFDQALGIPAKANADSEGNANGIPGRRRTVLGA